MQKKILVILLSFVFILSFSVDAEAQSRKKKKKGKQRPAKTEQVDETEESETKSQRSSRVSDEDEKHDYSFSKDNLVYDIMGDFRIGRGGGGNTVLKFGLKPAISYKIWDRISFGVAPKIEYYFTNLVDREDLSEFDLGIEAFGRVRVIESIYLQLGYDFNNYIYYESERTWINSPVIGGGYMSGFGDWKYGAQALFLLDEKRRDYNNFPIELWFGFTYNL